jgi:hypothetical protein
MKIDNYKSFNENLSFNDKVLQLKDCFSGLQDLDLVFKYEIDEYNRILAKIINYESFRINQEIDNNTVDFQNLDLRKCEFKLTDEIINIIKFANSYCEDIGLIQGMATYYIDDDIRVFDNMEELYNYKDKGKKTNSIDLIYVEDK